MENNVVLPMAISRNKNELQMSFEFPIENAESLFFLMKRQTNEFFNTFCLRFEKNLLKRSTVKNLTYKLMCSNIIVQQTNLMNMKMDDVLSDDNILFISDRGYRIQYYSPTVIKFTFPKRFFINHFILPKIYMQNAKCQDCKFVWYCRSYDFKKKIELSSWIKLGCEDYALKLLPKYLNSQFKLEIEPHRDNVIGVRSIHYTTSLPEILKCNFNYLEKLKFISNSTSPNEFRIVCYNLLAEMYTDTKESKDMFAYCAKEYLEFSYRKAVLCNEILSYSADIYLFQEVDSTFYNSLSLTLKEFESNYSPKKDIHEGCAIFHRKSKFKYITDCQYLVSDLLRDPIHEDLCVCLKTNHELFKRLITLPNKLMITTLEELSTNRKWIIANTHLYAGETADTVRFLQAYLCFIFLQSFQTNFNESYLVFGGDFNSTPDTNVLEILNKTIDLNSFPEYSEIHYDFKLDLKLISACGLPNYTNYTRNFVGCLDYIFIDHDKLKVKNVVPFPSHEEIIENEAIPSEKFPSDHIPLICTIEY